MEGTPKGPGSSFRANIIRVKTFWEIGLELVSDPGITYGGNRDITVTIGSGAHENFQPSLKMATGSIILAHGVTSGDVDMAFVNPSACLTQAYKGTGMFDKPLPVRIVANYPSWDRFVVVAHPRIGITSLAEIKERRIPVRMSIREDPTHSTLVLLNQILAVHGFSLADIESWGGSFQLNGPPHDKRRMDALYADELDIICDEGIPTMWFDEALEQGMQPITLDDEVFEAMEAIGWRKVTIPAGRFPHLTQDYDCIDFSGWPIYTRAELDDETVYKVCAAIRAKNDAIPWDGDSYTDVNQVWQESAATPADVPYHPGAVQWCKDNGIKV